MTTNDSQAALTAAPFGTLFAPWMSNAWYRAGGWEGPRLEPLAPLSMHPGAHVLHYASSCFEGMKAFRAPGGAVNVFRLDRHLARMQESAALLCLPIPGVDVVRSMVLDLVAACAGEVPEFPGALYLRPTLIGTEANVGAAGSPPAEVCLYVLGCPVGDYFSGGLRPLRVVVEDRHPRTTADFGRAKTGANYASALRHVMRGHVDHEADTVLFCPGGDVQETSSSNFLLLNDREVVTKPLDDSYLHGVTRDSLLRLARRLGYEVAERDISVAEMLEWVRTGEAALSGTAAVLGAVGTLIHEGREHRVGDGGVGPNTRRLREALTGIQSGRDADPFGWLCPVPPARGNRTAAAG